MRLFVSVIGLLVGLAGLGYAALTETGGWSFPWLPHLVFWLPLTSVFSLVILLMLARCQGIRWPVVTGLIGGIALVQYVTTDVCSSDSRVPLVIMPLVLVALSATAIVGGKGPRIERVVTLANRYRRWCLAAAVLAAIALFAGQAIWNARAKELERQAFQALQAEDDLKNRELKGLPRATWMLSKTFDFGDFSEEQFLKDKRFKHRFLGEFRWDDEQQRLVITQQLFHDDVIRERLLPRAEQVLQHPLLKPGVRDDLQGGVLTCTPPLDCQVVWTIDVDQIEYEWPIGKEFTPSTDFIGRRLVEEFYKPPAESK